jgi:biopolymer transport protein ExbD
MDLTPMIDCVFLLLIFFVLVTQVVSDRIPLDPPTSSAANEEKLPKDFATVNVDRDGIVYLGAQKMASWQDFRRALQTKVEHHARLHGKEKNGDRKISKLDLYIRGDLISQWKLTQEVVAMAQDLTIYRTEYAVLLKKEKGGS